MASRELGPIVRFVSQTTASVWVQLDERCAVMLSAKPLTTDKKAKKKTGTEHVVWTVEVGSRNYAVAYLTDLAAATQYKYRLSYVPLYSGTKKSWPETPADVRKSKYLVEDSMKELALGTGPVFRTFAEPKKEPFRLAFGSCRKWQGGADEEEGADILSEFGDWLLETQNDRLTRWPHTLLMLGDQIYADSVSPDVRRVLFKKRRKYGLPDPFTVPTTLKLTPRSLERLPSDEQKAGAGNFHLIHFDEFATMYEASWADKRVCNVFANVPTFMIFDDHDVTDDWNLTAGWIQQAEDTSPWSASIADALVAYWLYQGWGNLDPSAQDTVTDKRVAVLLDAAKDGTDALSDLQELFLATTGPSPEEWFRYHYEIPSSPPIVMLDTRNDRMLHTEKVKGGDVVLHASKDDRIISQTQMGWLERQFTSHSEPVFVASSIPFLQPMRIDQIQYAYARLGAVGTIAAETTDQDNADGLEDERRERDLEAWMAFPTSVLEMSRALASSTVPVILLGGDVHFSYAVLGNVTPPKSADDDQRGQKDKSAPKKVIQLVSSGFQAHLSAESKKQNEALWGTGTPSDGTLAHLDNYAHISRDRDSGSRNIPSSRS